MVIEAFSILKEKVWDPYMGLEEKVETLKRNVAVLISRRRDVMAEVKDAELHSSKRRKTEVENWQSSVQKLEHEFECFELEVQQSSNYSRIRLSNRADKIHKEVEDLIDQGKFSEGILLNVNEEKGQPLVTTNLKGQTFDQSLREVLVFLGEVSSIGIYGMGGVGKTTLAMHIHNHLLKESRFSGHVYWVTVSQDFSVTKLQNDIAKALDLDLSTEDDDKKRAAKLYQNLKRKESFVLILDDVWTNFDVKKLGIPLEIGGGKLIMTSRSVEVCDRIGCQKKVKVATLSVTESWELFVETLGHSGDLPMEIEEIAKRMTKKCDGLPLGVIAMAASMRGVNDVFEWRDAFEEFTESCMKMENMNNEVFPILRCSYNRLRDPRLQKCFLYCCLYPEDFKIERDELIRLFIVEELLVKRNSRGAEFDQGHALLNKLERACLLESVVNYRGERCMRMHDLVREMALQIGRDEFKWMVKAGAQLVKIPGDQEWSEDLDKVSLMVNDVTEIALGLSYVRSRLTTLSLLRNRGLHLVVNSFFVQLPGLRVLDLSYTVIQQLPSSVSNLESLAALLLRFCDRLRFVPPLNKLKNLIELDLCGTTINEVPEGLESLVNLRCLDMKRFMSIIPFKRPPINMFARLSNLQTLLIPFGVRVEDLEGMKQLEEFQGEFVDICSFNKFVKYRQHCRQPRFFEITLDPRISFNLNSNLRRIDDIVRFTIKRVILMHLVLTIDNGEMLSYDQVEEEAGGGVALLPLDTQELEIWYCDFRNMSNSLVVASPSLIQLKGLKRIKICKCHGIECLIRLSNCNSTVKKTMGDHGITSTCNPLQSVEKLDLKFLDDFTGLFKLEFGEALPPFGTFSHLQHLDISDCNKMRKLIPRWLLQYLLNLTVIDVRRCNEMEEIVTEDEEKQVSLFPFNQSKSISNDEVILPKLRVLCLENLQQLKSIYQGRVTCDSIKHITVLCCRKLKRLPFTLPVCNGQPSTPPALESIKLDENSWESLEWDHPQYKNVLHRFVKKPMR